MEKKKKEDNMRSGFDAPSYGVAIPRDYVMVRKKNGRIAFVPPSEKKKKTK